MHPFMPSTSCYFFQHSLEDKWFTGDAWKANEIIVSVISIELKKNQDNIGTYAVVPKAC